MNVWFDVSFIQSILDGCGSANGVSFAEQSFLFLYIIIFFLLQVNALTDLTHAATGPDQFQLGALSKRYVAKKNQETQTALLLYIGCLAQWKLP